MDRDDFRGFTILDTVRGFTILDTDCPVGTVYRVSAEYARRQSKWEGMLESLPSDAQAVIVMHPATDPLDVPAFRYGEPA